MVHVSKIIRTRHPAWRWLRLAGVLVLAAWLLPGCVNRMFYYPDTHVYRTAKDFPYPVREIFFDSLDGTELHGWLLISPATNPLGTVVHFHGNAQNISAHADFVDWLPREGYHVFIFDYRGFGKSKGRPTREGVYMDGVAAMMQAMRLPGIESNRLFVIGQSLGGAVALSVAGSHPEFDIKAMVIDSSFYSYRGIVKDKLKDMPLLSLAARPLSKWLTSDTHSPHLNIAQIQAPVMFIHGTRDYVIPHHHSEMLYESAREPKELLLIDGAAHISALHSHRFDTAPRIIRFFTEQIQP
ncbi:MAG TPA: alpha/beta fold hydrolase [Kiritimatiellia bacterium]|nr:alpha/beta fold hydrolase [Kiritimatiellia bacterium]